MTNYEQLPLLNTITELLLEELKELTEEEKKMIKIELGMNHLKTNDYTVQTHITKIQEILQTLNKEINTDHLVFTAQKKLETLPTQQHLKEMIFFKNIKVDNFLENAEQYYKNIPYFYDKNNLFWRWNHDQSKYERIDEIEIMIKLENYLKFNGQTINSIIKNNYLEAFKRVGRQHIPLSAPSRWIQFRDKAFSIRSGKIHKVQPNYFFTNPIPHEIGTSSETPVIDKLFADWVGDKKQILYEFIAYCCLSEYPIHLIFCLVGCGRNGKSKYLKLIQNFVGSDNICSTELDTLISSRFESFKLYKKLVCVMGETNFGILNRTSMLKRLTGQDLIGFEFKNKMPFDDYNYAKIVISSNSLPTTEDTSEGFYRRWMIIPFENIFPEGKDIIGSIPVEEYSALAKKVTEILPGLLRNEKFSWQGSIEDRKKAYIMNSNPLSLFIEKYCVKDIGSFLRYGELYNAYVKYLTVYKKRVISHKEFSNMLVLEGYEVRKTSKQVEGFWVNDRFIEGMRFVTDVTVVTQSSLYSPIKELSENFSISVTTVTEGVKPSFSLQHIYSNIDVEDLKVYIETVPFDNKDKILQFFGEVNIRKWLSDGIIYENPAGTYRLNNVV